MDKSGLGLPSLAAVAINAVVAIEAQALVDAMAAGLSQNERGVLEE